MHPPAAEACASLLPPVLGGHHYPTAEDTCERAPGAPVALAAVLVANALAAVFMAAMALAWFFSACLRRRPAPRTPEPPKKEGPVAAQLALLVAEVADLRAQVEALVAPQPLREGKTIYYIAAAGGRKIHADAACLFLAKAAAAAGTVELPLDADAAAFVYKAGAACIRCAGPHPPSGERADAAYNAAERCFGVL